MTKRAIILGVLGAMLLAGVGYLNDFRWKLNPIVGNHLPISVFGLLLLTVMAVNPLLRRLGARWQLGGAELAVIVTLMLAVCSIPGSGLLRCFLPAITLPPRIVQQDTGWKAANVLHYIPPQMMPGGGTYDEEVVNGYINGLSRPGHHIGLGAVPWRKWSTPLTVWGSLIALVAVGSVCLSLIVHRQWSHNERLRYPIADFASSVMAQDSDGGSPILRNKLFWGAAASVFTLHLINGYHAWNPGSIEIPLTFHFDAITQKWPQFTGQAYGAWVIVTPRIILSVVAFAFFLAGDVGFSLGIAHVAGVAVLLLLYNRGVMDAGYSQGGMQTWQLFGSYLGLGLLVLWVGRRYYAGVLKGGLGMGKPSGVDSTAIWALRVLLIAAAAICAILIWLGLEWTLAWIVVVLIFLAYMVVARINAESGMFFIHQRWQAVGVLMGLLGIHAMGPKAIAIVGLLCAVLTMDLRECMMPFLVNGLKMSDDLGVRPGKFEWAIPATFVVGLALAVTVALWDNYDKGAPLWEPLGAYQAPRLPFNEVQKAVQNMSVSGTLDSSVGLTPVERIAQMKPSAEFLWATGIGLALVLGASFLRLRYTWWPLHPVMFLVWNTWPCWAFSASLLFGWMIKSAVTRFGGGRQYRKLKPLMIGVIAGDLLSGLFWMALGAAYYLATGLQPKDYYIFPA